MYRAWWYIYIYIIYQYIIYQYIYILNSMSASFLSMFMGLLLLRVDIMTDCFLFANAGWFTWKKTNKCMGGLFSFFMRSLFMIRRAGTSFGLLKPNRCP